MEIRDFRPEDRQEYLDMSVDFYSGDASLFDVDMKKFEDTFELGVKGSPLMRGLTITEGDEIIGYALLAFYWSCEAGGFTVQAEELYFKPQMRGKGCGHKFFQWYLKNIRRQNASVWKYAHTIQRQNCCTVV